MEAISTRIPVDKADFKNYFPKNSKTMLKKRKTSATFQEKNICPATQSGEQHLMMMKTFIQIFLVIRIIQFAVVNINPFSHGYAESTWN
ncbi:transmembrane protein, putative [Medicago truncatula]|uniref:Transmembrane protein, putative n=1 Tax=Medicago truncatula TaxID=3880 RepID=G7KLH9_MEDTR|nr:transmembrane protein, putative [Medicago truncatula]